MQRSNGKPGSSLNKALLGWLTAMARIVMWIASVVRVVVVIVGWASHHDPWTEGH